MPKKNSMNDELESIWVPKPKAWGVVVLVIGILCHWKLAEGNIEHSGRKLDDYVPGFISIDCGATSDYLDESTGIVYKSDKGFIDTGTNNEISPEYYYANPDYGRLTRNLRSFPQGKKNCYTLKPEQGKNNNYLIRAFFHYGNYDNMNKIPKFDVYVGVNYWTTVEPSAVNRAIFPDMIHVPTSDIIFVCLINTGSGIPFISALELRPLDKSLYPFDFGALCNSWRYNRGTTVDEELVRYKSDAYDRFWYSDSTLSNWVPINNSSAIDIQGSNDNYKPPSEVLRTAFQPPSGYHALLYDWNNSGDNSKRYVCFHFAEIAELKQGKKREFIISVNGGTYTSKPITLDHFKPLSICLNQIFQGHFSFSINATAGSDLPPILNAFEVYGVISPFYLFNATDSRDVTAIMEIKQTSKISREDWQGDPCSPNIYTWIGLTCSSDYTPRIISLNLSSCQLTGEIPISLSNLTALLYLDLSYNQLTGNIPQFLAQLPNLKTLNLSGNKFDGSVPEALIQKSGDGSLILSLGEMSDLCLSAPCTKKEKKQKKELIVVALVATSAIILVLMFIFCALAIYKRKRQVTNTNVLNWNQRLQIAVDAAHGLEYLHNGCKPPIIHRDLKTPNILLTENMQAKIADFGLSRAFATENDSHVCTGLAGTLGYLDPESQASGKLNKKSDVYSFGIVLFELITGRPAIMRKHEKNIHILDWVYPVIESGDIGSIVDPRLQREFHTNSAWKAVEIAMSCIPLVAIQRSDMSQVLVELKECLALEMAHGRSQTMEIENNETTSSIPLIMSSMELQSDIAALVR